MDESTDSDAAPWGWPAGCWADKNRSFACWAMEALAGTEAERLEYRHADQGDKSEASVWLRGRRGLATLPDGRAVQLGRVTGTKMLQAANGTKSLLRAMLWPEHEPRFRGNAATHHGNRHENCAREILTRYVDQMLKREAEETGEMITWAIREYGLLSLIHI